MNFIINTIILLAITAAKQVNGNCIPSITIASGTHAPRGPICANTVIFNENFNTLNKNIWKHERSMFGGGNNEFEWYVDSRKNTFVKNGKLYIRPTLTTSVVRDLTNCHIKIQGCTTPWAGCEHHCSADSILSPVRSGKVFTRDSFSFKYGRLKIRAKLPAGDWLWPALWLMPQHDVYGGWPQSGEIDLMENRGNRNLVNGVNEIGSALHKGLMNQAAYNGKVKRGQDWYKRFHVYQMDWTPNGITFKVDNDLIGTISVHDEFIQSGKIGDHIWKNGAAIAPFDQEFFIIMNLAVGSTNGYFPDTGNGNGKPWQNANGATAKRDFWNGRNQWLPSWNLNVNNGASSSLIVDYVRVIAL